MSSLTGKRICFVGKLGGMTKRDAIQMVRQHGGQTADRPTDGANLIVVGADELPLDSDGELLDENVRQAADRGHVEIIGETQLWERLGLLDDDARMRRLYTPAMLAELLQVPVATVRRWHRRGLIMPAKEVHRLPYFDFAEVATARKLANMLAAGISPAAIEKKLESLAQFVPGVKRPLAQLSVIIEGRQILLRQNEGLIDSSGQMRFDFESLEQREAEADVTEACRATVSFADFQAPVHQGPTPQDLLEAANTCEDQGQLLLAVEMYRAALAAGGPQPTICFQLAELLYRLGDVGAARERYYMAVELDGEFVEARANLGCVLAESGELEMAVAAFQGALSLHPDYADVHFQLARSLSELGRNKAANEHWQQFLQLAPDSPWADEARRCLGT
jgi:tetratricopeptide (TPR) repeat protein